MTCVQNNYDRLKFVFGRDIILCGWLGSEYKLTNQLTNQVAISLSCFVYFTHIQPADALEDHEGTVSISFADDIDGLAEEEEELANLVERLDKASTLYGMEISAEKAKLLTNTTSGINTEIKENGQKPWESHKLQVPRLSYNWWGFQARDTLQDSTDNSSIDKAETSLEWQRIYLCSKMRLMRSLVTSIFLYACEPWTLTVELQRRIQAMDMRCYRKILHISYKDHVTNEAVRAKIQQAIGPHEDLLTTVKRHKLQWYGHVSHSSGLAKTVLQGTVKGVGGGGREDKADRGRGGKTTSGNGQAWSSPSPRGQWRTGENGGNWLRNHL